MTADTTKTLTWDDVKHHCYPGSPVDVECWVPRRRMAFYVLYPFVEDGDTYLMLSDGSYIFESEYQPPLGWQTPEQAAVVAAKR